MLRNLKVGTKVLAVVLPPLIVLVAVAGVGAKDRLNDANDAKRSEEFTELVEAGRVLVSHLQFERMVSALRLTGDQDITDQLSEVWQRTDTAWAAYQDRASGVGPGSSIYEPVERSLARMTDLSTIRASTDRGGIDPLIANQWYSDTIATQLSVASAVADTIPVVEVSADMASYVALSQAHEAQAKRAAVYTIALGVGEFDAHGRLWREERAAVNEYDRYESLFFDIATPAQSASLRGALATPASTNSIRFQEGVLHAVAGTVNFLGDGTSVNEPLKLTPRVVANAVGIRTEETLDAAYFVNLAERQLVVLDEPSVELLEGVSGVVAAARSDAERQALLYLLVTAAAVLMSAALATFVARRLTQPLRNLTDAADRLSTEQLPALVEQLKSPGAGSAEVELAPIAMDRVDEIGQLADAFDSIQRVTVEVAEEQAALLKKGIGDLFVNLARRNQTLLDRQIEFIDQLEEAEEDPDVLEDLFKLDHLATRMRRNAESLLVLAGIETGHRRSRPVELTDVVRVALGEIEDFARINLLTMDDAVVTGSAAMDVAHLIAELMENATSFSPPETRVDVLGHRNSDGTYVLSVSDQGIGMSEQQLAENNQLLAEPPLVGLTLSRSLGFTVVGRLAARFNIGVRLTPSPTGGITALITLPTSILVSPEEAAAAPAPVAATSQPLVVPVATEPGREWVDPAPAATTLAGALPSGAAFDAGLAALMGDEPTPQTTETGPDPARAPSAETAASAPALTSAGLVRRVPRASAAGADAPRVDDGASAPRQQRSPEEVRAMLSRYRSGLHRGREDSGPADRPTDTSN